MKVNVETLAATGEPPVVVVPRGRPALAYARSANVLLPLRFAQEMPEWRRPLWTPITRTSPNRRR